MTWSVDAKSSLEAALVVDLKGRAILGPGGPLIVQARSGDIRVPKEERRRRSVLEAAARSAMHRNPAAAVRGRFLATASTPTGSVPESEGGNKRRATYPKLASDGPIGSSEAQNAPWPLSVATTEATVSGPMPVECGLGKKEGRPGGAMDLENLRSDCSLPCQRGLPGGLRWRRSRRAPCRRPFPQGGDRCVPKQNIEHKVNRAELIPAMTTGFCASGKE